ncbi:MAG: nuclear transport factor 2 family protein [Pseudomonadota bacterium]|nr:nuclear transport factor 2 family protein [Pseudomonadota bacterium]
MADLLPVIETLENRWMRAWISGDARTLKSLTSGKFIMLFGSKPSVILDSRSWLEAATTRYLCTSYRFGDLYVREVGGVALFASQLELKAKLDGQDWSGTVFVTDLWKKSKMRRRWMMIERVVSRPDEAPHVPAAIRSLQLWKSGPGRLD